MREFAGSHIRSCAPRSFPGNFSAQNSSSASSQHLIIAGPRPPSNSKPFGKQNKSGKTSKSVKQVKQNPICSQGSLDLARLQPIFEHMLDLLKPGPAVPALMRDEIPGPARLGVLLRRLARGHAQASNSLLHGDTGDTSPSTTQRLGLTRSCLAPKLPGSMTPSRQASCCCCMSERTLRTCGSSE